MKSFRFWKAFGFCALFAAAVSSLVSCGGKASIDGTLADAPLSEVVVKKLDVNRYVTLDTLKVDSDGKYSCRIDIEKGQPEFVYVFYGDRKVASVLLDRGDRLTVVSDTVGNFTVEGSEESRRFAEVEKDYARFTAEFDSLTNCLLALDPVRRNRISVDSIRLCTSSSRKGSFCISSTTTSPLSIPSLRSMPANRAGSFSSAFTSFLSRRLKR